MNIGILCDSWAQSKTKMMKLKEKDTRCYKSKFERCGMCVFRPSELMQSQLHDF